MRTSAVAVRPLRVATGSSRAYWALRFGAAFCFVGHGAFGFITKAAWIPYFGVVGIGEPWAWRLMPLIGTVDVLAAMAVLFAPRALPLVYMTAWAAWTSLLRPLAGEPIWEAIERAGNYGVPLALLTLTGSRTAWRDLLRRRECAVDEPRALAGACVILRWTTCLLLVGHGALGALYAKPILASQYATIGLPPSATAIIGWFEICLGAAVGARPSVPLLLFIAAWKLASESLWIAAGAPIWEFVERAGSYAAPLALASLIAVARRQRTTTPSQAPEESSLPCSVDTT